MPAAELPADELLRWTQTPSLVGRLVRLEALSAAHAPAIARRANFAVLLSGQVAGRISYSEVRPTDGWLEIGTMLTPPYFGTAANPEAKLLLLTRAFEVLGAGRVHFKVDERNERSLRAMTRLGAVREGTLRH
ncbi:GNAT family protein [Deinococcus sp.]|uniref:GNAT family N-acetyltransferase n=1 Tax=Deinococcus sp. TaxID=47478 RepID=UPI00344C6DF7